MTAQILGSELSNLIQESRRKLPELRNAAEKSLQELKALTVTSEAQLAADLARKSQFIDPFLIACSSRNGKYASSGMVCLQRLAVSSAVPRGRLKEVVDALKDCASLGLDIQLRILQILPPLLQNYSDSIQGDLLFVALETCSTLQASKTQAISGTAVATLQQLVVSVFERLNTDHGDDRTVTEISINDHQISLTVAAYDAYRILVDLCSMAQGGKLQYIHFSNLSSVSVMELIEPIMTNYIDCIRSHEELSTVLRTELLPFLLKTFAETQRFALSVRSIRLINLAIRHYIELFPAECEAAMVVIVHALDPEVAPSWKRALCLEVLRGVFSDSKVVLQIHGKLIADQQSKKIIRDCLGTFVRIASEKPALIGLGQHSTLPVGNYFQREASGERKDDQAAATSGSATIGVPTATVPGISMQFSSVKVPCLDQLDKTEPPSLNETYIYSLVLASLTELAESLAKFILPLTVQTSGRSKKRPKPQEGSGIENPEDEPSESSRSNNRKAGLKRSHSYRKRTIPQNPMTLENHPAEDNIQIAASLVDDTWPAFMACCSTFFNSALDADYYRALVRSFQKFAQVVGLLRMSTPRDAFLTTLGRAAIPSQTLTSSVQSVGNQPIQSPSIFGGAKGFLNVENIVNQASTFLPERARRSSIDSQEVILNSRNLLCLRALLNLAIALGPLLDSSWTIVLETMQQAETILSASRFRPPSRDRATPQSPTQSSSDSSTAQGLGSEVTAVQAAVTRLFESTVDFPNESFNYVLQSLRNLLHLEYPPQNSMKALSPQTPTHQRRVSSLSTLSIRTDASDQDPIFVLDKLRQIGALNLDRFVDYEPAESGWRLLIDTAIPIATGVINTTPAARLTAVEVISQLCQQIFSSSLAEDMEAKEELQERALSPILSVSRSLQQSETAPGRSSAAETDLQVHLVALEALRAMLERGGDFLHGAWGIVFSTILTAFDKRTQSTSVTRAVWSEKPEKQYSRLLSAALGRSAFSSIQLTCSDFLSTVPDEVLLPLTNLLFSFASQSQDVNISLTTTTLFWNVSDFVYGKIKSDSLNFPISDEPDEEIEKFTMIQDDYKQHEGGSLPLLWLLVLHQITAIITDSREEVRNGAVHTIIRIFDNHGDDFSPRAWQLCLKQIFMRVMAVDLASYNAILPAEADSADFEPSVNDVKSKVETSQIIVQGVCKLFSAHIETIVQAPRFDDIAQKLLSALEAKLHLRLLDLSAEVYSSISMILSKHQTMELIGSDFLKQVWSIWASNFPTGDSRLPTQDNQAALLAYIKLFNEIYRLRPSILQQDGSVSVAATFRRCIAEAVPSTYSSDIDSVTPVQAVVLESFSMINTTSAEMSLPIIEALASFIVAPFEASHQVNSTNRTFVALSKKSMDTLERIIFRHFEQNLPIMQSALLMAVESLKIPIRLKYEWATQGRHPPLWQKATATAIKILDKLVPRFANTSLDQDIVWKYWKAIIQTADSVAHAHGQSTHAIPAAEVLSDEQFDIGVIKKLHGIIIPSLGYGSAPDSERRAYACTLFEASITHQMEEGDLPDYRKEPLAGIYDVRFGRTYKPTPVVRYEMAYCCLELLISLVSLSDSSQERIKLSQAAAPYLILRTALPVKGYIADQPLRGRMPQPLSEREELLFILRELRQMKSEPKAIPDAEGAKSIHRKHLIRLSPLITRAIGVASRDPVALLELQACLVVVGEEFDL